VKISAAGDPGEVLGHTVPRVFTPPLIEGPPGPCGCGCALTPSTSDGFDVVWFAERVLGAPLDPWQRWLVIHGLELLPDGRPRFRRILVLVARQNGKTHLLTVLAAFWLTVLDPIFILGTSTKTSVAKEPWQRTIDLVRDSEHLRGLIGRGSVRRAAGEEELTLTNRSRYKVSAANEDGGRGLPLDRVKADELRSHHDYSAYGAAYYAMRARPYAQWWGISSMGDDRSIVLNDLRSAALAFVDDGAGDARLGIFEWSPPANSDPLDPQALAAANPNVGRRFPMGDLLGEAEVAVRKGGEALADFKTEAMNLHVGSLDPAIDPEAWGDCVLAGDLESLRGGLVMVVDVQPDGRHVTLLAGAQMPDGRVRIEPVTRWEGDRAVHHAERDLPGILMRNRPRKFGWLPKGPGAALVATVRERKGRTSWPPRGVTVEEIGTEAPAACMSLAAAVIGRQIVHANDPLLTAQALAATKLWRGEEWRFGRRGETGVDALYAAAGVVLLARTLPTPVGRPRVILPTRRP